MSAQHPPGPVATRKAIDSLLAQLNADYPGYRWRVAVWPEGLGGSAEADATLIESCQPSRRTRGERHPRPGGDL